MHRMISSDTKVADITAIGVNALAGWTWLSNTNDILQLVLTIAGIVAAIAAARYHIIKTKVLKKNEPQRKD